LKIKKYIPWIIRILISLVFVVSGIAKLFPVWAFEKQLVDLGITSWCYAPYLARFMLSFEISVAILILQPHYLRMIVIPATILLLVAFSIHLSIEIYHHGAMSGNCGCFGQLIPMTPLEALIKNIISIALLIYLHRIIHDRKKGHNRFVYLLLGVVFSALLLFVLFPFCPCEKFQEEKQQVYNIDTINGKSISNDTNFLNITEQKTQDTTILKEKSAIEPDNIAQQSMPVEPKSRFGKYKVFGKEKVNLDEGKKVLCFFSPGCEDCVYTAKELSALSKKTELPPIYIFFMNEEAELIPGFLKEANFYYPYTILEVPVFWQLLGLNADTPGVILLWNGNIMRYYEGLDKNKFDVGDFENACKSING
jgi:uncharacterized membrane protein YphA (DoxX/SURF4 family)/thiol-disulfide isomerase/thioredoxin